VSGRPAVAAAIELVSAGATLPAALAEATLEEMVDGAAPPVQVAALLAMLRLRGETSEELAAFARVMREHAVRVDAPEDAVDLAGTGADGSGSFNVSTVAAFVAAGAGASVAKHGNRAITSRCGSADLIEALNIPLEPGPEAVARSIRDTGFGFMFAPAFHPAMREVMPIRRALPMRTAFNLIGPLSSPAHVRRQLIGVADPSLLAVIAGALARMDVVRALVVHGADGMDELSLAGANRALLVEAQRITELEIEPMALGLAAAPAKALQGGDPQLNAAITLSVLGGEPGPPRDVVLLNAAAALWVAGVASDLDEGLERAAASIDSGRASDVAAAAAEAVPA
jgi:anthranilate phosphoribosyltransferase